MTINIEELKRDREAGTDGPWDVDGRMISHGLSTVALMCEFDSFGGLYEAYNGQINGRRIARLPDLEEAFLEAVEALENVCDYADIAGVRVAREFLDKIT